MGDHESDETRRGVGRASEPDQTHKPQVPAWVGWNHCYASAGAGGRHCATLDRTEIAPRSPRLRKQKRRRRAEDSDSAGNPDSYPTYGVHWGLESGIISKKEVAIIWEAIANIEKRVYYYPETVDGEHFIDCESFMFVVDTNFKHPIVQTIYQFNEEYESTMEYAKRRIIDAKGIESETQESLAVIEKVYGAGYVKCYDFESRGTYGGKNGRGEGADRSRSSGRTGKQARQREWIFEEDGDVEQHQQRTETLTDREVLAMAADQVKASDLNAAEQDALRIFKERLHKLDDLQEKRAEQGRLYKEHQFGAKVDRAAASETLNRMHVLDEQIQKASAELLSVEEKTVLKRVLQKSRKVVETEERQHGQELLARWRDRRNNAAAIKKYRERLRGDVDDLTTGYYTRTTRISKFFCRVAKRSFRPALPPPPLQTAEDLQKHG